MFIGSRGATPPGSRKSPTSEQATQAEPLPVPDTSKPPPSQQPLQQQQQHQQNENRRRLPQNQSQHQNRDRGWERRDQPERDRGWERHEQQDYRQANMASYAKGRGNNRGK